MPFEDHRHPLTMRSPVLKRQNLSSHPRAQHGDDAHLFVCWIFNSLAQYLGGADRVSESLEHWWPSYISHISRFSSAACKNDSDTSAATAVYNAILLV